MANELMPRYLEVWLHNRHIGWLCEAGRITRFVPTEPYLSDFERPTLSLSMTLPGEEAVTQSILRNNFDPAVYRERGELPPFFAGLLPEGPLRARLKATRRNQVDTDDFGLLAAAGEDLPGAVKVLPANLNNLTEAARAYGVTGGSDNLEIAVPEAAAEGAASLSGIQDKLALSSAKNGQRCHIPMRGTLSDLIVKLPLPGNDEQVMNEWASMRLAELAGVVVAPCRPLPMETIDGHDDLVERLGASTRYLRVTRFDRAPGGAVHMEDGCQLLRLMPDQKYGPGKAYALLIGALSRMSRRGIEDVRQFFIRQTVNTMLGNADAHLKNTSVVYPDGIHPELSPAYDIVCVAALPNFNGFPLNRAIDARQRQETVATYEAMATQAGVSPRIARAAVKQTIERIHEQWPRALAGLEAPDAVRKEILGRLETLPLGRMN